MRILLSIIVIIIIIIVIIITVVIIIIINVPITAMTRPGGNPRISRTRGGRLTIGGGGQCGLWCDNVPATR